MSHSHRSRQFVAILLVQFLVWFCSDAQRLGWAQVSTGEGRGWMGLYIRDLDPLDLRALDLPADQQGVVVSGVDDDGPAAQVGIEPGDVITSLDGKSLDSRRDFVSVLGDRRVGDRVRLQVVRRRTSRNIEFRLQERPREMQGSVAVPPGVAPAPTASTTTDDARLHCIDLRNADLAQYFGVDVGEGVLVLEVHGDDLDRLRAGDVITAVDDTPVTSTADLRRLWHTAADAQRTTVRLVRNRRPRSIRVPMQVPVAVVTFGEVPGQGAAASVDAQNWEQLRREVVQLQKRLETIEAQVDAQVRR